jgi:hypothetical protein
MQSSEKFETAVEESVLAAILAWFSSCCPARAARLCSPLISPKPRIIPSPPRSAPRSKPPSPSSWPRPTSPAFRSRSSRTVSYEWATGFGFADLRTTFPPANTRSTAWHRSRNRSRPRRHATLGARPTRSRRAGPEILPRVPQKQAPITTRQVMGHLGGIRHYKTDGQDDLEIGNTKHFDDPIQGGLDFFKNDRTGCAARHSLPLLDPGIHAGRLRDGRRLRRQVHRLHAAECFRPRRHGAHSGRRPLRHHPLPHSLLSEIEIRRRPERRLPRLQLQIPGGGWLSSAEDMAHFEVAILNDKLIKRSTRDLMWTPLKPSDGSKDNYGLGWGAGDENGIAVVATPAASRAPAPPS